MNQPDYQHQTGEPLFPDIIWNRPVARHSAGRLLVIGGHSGDFSLPTAIYALAEAAGVGECSVVLPDRLIKLLGGTPATAFVASSQSGSLGRPALGRLLELSEEADAIALGASLSNNSETASLIERFIQETDRPIIAFAEALVALQFNPTLLSQHRPGLLIQTMPEAFKLAGRLKIPLTIRRDGGLINKLEIVRTLKQAIAADLVIYGNETIVAVGEQLSVTPANPVLSRLPAAYYAALSVFWLQNPRQPYQGLTTAAWILRQAGRDLPQQEAPTVTKVASVITETIGV